MIDDIATYGWHNTHEATRILTEYVRPIEVHDAEGSVVRTPMQLNLERTGKQVHKLDLDISVMNNGILHTKVCNKREHLEAIHNYRN
jgi:hypothetical protein